MYELRLPRAKSQHSYAIKTVKIEYRFFFFFFWGKN